MVNLPTPNKTPGDPQHTQDTNLIIEGINTLESRIDNIAAGPQGPPGEPGAPGTNGLSATVTVAGTSTSAPGGPASVTNIGTSTDVQLSFVIPRGQTGPQGPAGSQGPIGPTGATGATGGTGAGVKPGGLDGQVLSKASNSDFDTEWVFPGSAPVISVDGRQGAVTLGDLYDAAGAATAAQTAAEAYADSLAPNYDAAGTAASAVSTHNSDTTSVHGITNTADLVYTTDARLTDARTPTAHAASHESGGSDEIEIAPSQVTGTAVVDNDARLTDARTPTAHATSHESGGTDEIEIAPSQVTGTAVVDNDARLTDARTPTAHATSHESGGTDELELAPAQITGTALTESELSDTNASELSDTAAAGTSGDVSRADHVHDIMYDIPAGAVSFDTAPTGLTEDAGTAFWDADFGTLSLVLTGGNVVLPIGQKSGAEVKNDSGTNITKGKVVQFDGAAGGNIRVEAAVNDGTVSPKLYLGVAAEAISNGGQGFVVETGYIRGLNTNAWAVGTLLYIGASGDLTNTAPAKPAFQVPVAVVTFQNSSAGVIYVRIDNGVELNEVFDVEIDTPLDGQVLSYNDADSKWENITFTGGATGGGTDAVFYENDQTVTTNYTITSSKNAMTAGPVTIDGGVTVTIPSGSVWTVV